MASLFEIGKTGVQAYRQALSVTGQNIANINTEGYNKRSADITEIAGVSGGATNVSDSSGLGVRVAKIRRSFDSYLSDKTRTSQSDYEMLNDFVSKLSDLENMLLPSGSDLGVFIGRFFDSLQDVASSPDSISARTVSLEAGRALSSSFNNYDKQLKDFKSSSIRQVDVKLTEANLYLNQLVKVNGLISGSGSKDASNDILDARDNSVILNKGVIITEDDIEKIEKAGIDQVKVRSALTCETQPGICAACYGRDLARGTPVNIGEAVGVIAAQSIGEPGTQLTMRTFHIGGAAQRGAEQSKIEAPFDGKIRLDNSSLVNTEDGSEIVLSRSSEMLILDDQGREKARYRLQYGAKLLKKDGSTVKAGQVLAEWDPYTIPIITEKEGTAHYVDLVDGVSMREIIDESTGIGSRVVLDWKQQSGGSNLRPRITLRDADGEVINLPNGLEARYFMSMNAILSVENGSKVKAGAVLARIPRESSKTRDITGGLPRVAELFEARKPKDFAIISESDGVVEFGADYKAKRRIRVVPQDSESDAVEYMVPKGKLLAVQEGDFIRKGDMIIDGSPVPHDILNILGVEALADYLVKEVQDVYRLQGVKINDKHIEVIVRQMLQKTEVTDHGGTTFLNGEHVNSCLLYTSPSPRD